MLPSGILRVHVGAVLRAAAARRRDRCAFDGVDQRALRAPPHARSREQPARDDDSATRSAVIDSDLRERARAVAERLDRHAGALQQREQQVRVRRVLRIVQVLAALDCRSRGRTPPSGSGSLLCTSLLLMLLPNRMIEWSSSEPSPSGMLARRFDELRERARCDTSGSCASRSSFAGSFW